MCVCWGGEEGGPDPAPSSLGSPEDGAPAPSPYRTQESKPRPPLRPLALLLHHLPASQPVFPLSGSDEKPGFRGEGLGGDTEPSLLHPPPRSGPSLPATTIRARPAAGKEERSKGGGGKSRAPSHRGEPQAPGSEICKASARGPSSADHACGEPKAGPSGETAAPPWRPRAPDPQQPSSGACGGVQGPGPQPPPRWRFRAAGPPAPSSPLSWGLSPLPPALSTTGTQESIPTTYRSLEAGPRSSPNPPHTPNLSARDLAPSLPSPLPAQESEPSYSRPLPDSGDWAPTLHFRGLPILNPTPSTPAPRAVSQPLPIRSSGAPGGKAVH